MKRILIATDDSPHAARAGDHGEALAQLYGAELELFTSVFISSVPLGPYAIDMPGDFVEIARKQAVEKLEEMAVRMRKPDLPVSARVAVEDASTAICARAKEIDADLIAIGTRGRTGLAHVVLGSVAERVARLAPCPVLTAHSDSPAPSAYKTILVPTDFSKHAHAALEWAQKLAVRTAGRIILMHSTHLRPPSERAEAFANESFADALQRDAQKGLDELRNELGGLEVETHVSSTMPDLAVIKHAEQTCADLIVMGTRGLTGLSHVVLGSVAERVIRRSAVPVITLKVAD
ncbi:MAG: universal stress protein [bacterium]|nr:universal stress protein [bacterium]